MPQQDGCVASRDVTECADGMWRHVVPGQKLNRRLHLIGSQRMAGERLLDLLRFPRSDGLLKRRHR